MMLFRKPLVKAANEAYQICKALGLDGCSKEDKLLRLAIFSDLAHIDRKRFPTLWGYLETEDSVFTQIEKGRYQQ